MTLGYTPYKIPSNIAGGPDAIQLVARRRQELSQLAQMPARELSFEDRVSFNDAVDFWHPQQDALVSLVRSSMRSTVNKVGRTVVMVEGATGSGKSSLVEQAVMTLIGTNIVNAGSRLDSGSVLKDEQPLVWSLAGSAGQKSYASRLATAMDLPPLGAIDSNRMIDIAAREMRRAQTQIAVIDDLHAMSSNVRQDQGSNFLRLLLNVAPVTWIFITLDLATRTPVLRGGGPNGDLADQVIRRNRIITLTPVENSQAGVKTWSRALSRATRTVKLLETTPDNELKSLSRWLFSQTRGQVTEMFEVLKGAAVRAVDAEERFTQALIEESFEEVHLARSLRQSKDR